jgi:hypothetical protein
MSLADLIKSANFLTTDQNDRCNFIKALDKMKVASQGELEAGVLAFISHLQEQRIQDDMDEGVYMAGHCVKRLQSWTE